ncbi:lipopolysaccharide assembly protein LapA domain-containing protein [Amycolatopsis sp.]|uniref:lipopolysaccharide assembly protein LapA domain-containing protein n=1 Tax=Amycolatopsis sp. TaxID=37632 RepID=UPI002C4DD637|nr:lipopolysaccharide assembly protein LapA domain-containing protein [Amycolatopsis sp.]HVV10003.1 lipopolysaccharide assembly protein LapA domain-containing protein [Amycolatopsis sp.]
MTHAQESEPHEAPRPAPAAARPAHIKRTRVSGTWVAVIVALVLLVFLLIFILQNLEDTTITFLWGSGSMPLALAMLFSAIGGAALVALVGAARIMQLRKATKRARRSPQ